MSKRSTLSVMGRLSKLVGPLIPYMALAILLGVLGNLAATFVTVLCTASLLSVFGKVGISSVILLVIALVCALLRAFLRYGEQMCNHYCAFRILAIIRDKVFRALRRLAPSKLEGKDRGNLISVITSDIELLEVFYAHTISPIAIATLFSLIMTAFIAAQNLILGIVALLSYAAVGILLPVVTSIKGGDSADRYRKENGEMSSFILESLRGLGEILQYGNGKKRLSEMEKRADNMADAERRIKSNGGFNAAITNAFVLFLDFIMLFVSAILVSKGTLTPSAALLSVVALMSSFGPVIALSSLGNTLQNTVAAGNRVIDILDEEPVVKDITGKKDIEFNGAEASNVSFAYKDEDVLDDISVKVEKNSILGIVGKSGSGKSTLLKLFMRFWSPQKGEISISKRNLEDINTDDLRDMESFVSQDTVLFRDTISENIRIGKLDATKEEIVEAAKKASIHEFISSLPKGYDTPVGELGDTLSGGEKQRLGLARAFLHDSPFMLLDEPTSNLDSLNEAVILKSLAEERKGKTILLVSHRVSTMRIADSVISVEKGKINSRRES